MGEGREGSMDCQVGEQSKGRKEGQTDSSFLHHLESTFPVGVPAGHCSPGERTAADHLSTQGLGTFPPCLLLLSGTEVSEDLSQH